MAEPDLMTGIAALAEAVRDNNTNTLDAIKSLLPKNVQAMSAEAFAKVDLPRPPIPTFQNGLAIDLRGVETTKLAKTMQQLGEIPSGEYLDGIVKVTRTEPKVNTEGRLDLRYDGSTTEKRMIYASRVRDFSDMVDQIWREARKATA
jgi:hypothetical protein